jgi:hypothetical protein
MPQRRSSRTASVSSPTDMKDVREARGAESEYDVLTVSSSLVVASGLLGSETDSDRRGSSELRHKAVKLYEEARRDASYPVSSWRFATGELVFRDRCVSAVRERVVAGRQRATLRLPRFAGHQPVRRPGQPEGGVLRAPSSCRRSSRWRWAGDSCLPVAEVQAATAGVHVEVGQRHGPGLVAVEVIALAAEVPAASDRFVAGFASARF